jgi:hypothetical protein
VREQRVAVSWKLLALRPPVKTEREGGICYNRARFAIAPASVPGAGEGSPRWALKDQSSRRMPQWPHPVGGAASGSHSDCPLAPPLSRPRP